MKKSEWKKSDSLRGSGGGRGVRIGVGVKLAALVSAIAVTFVTVGLISYTSLQNADSEMNVARQLVEASQDLNGFAALSRSHLTLADVAPGNAEAAIATARESARKQRDLLNGIQPAMVYTHAGLMPLAALLDSTETMDGLLDYELLPALTSGDRAQVELSMDRIDLLHDQEEKNLTEVNRAIQSSISEWESDHDKTLVRTGWLQLLTGILAAAFALGLGYVVYSKMSRRLFSLHRTVDELSRGKLDSRVDVIGNDEIADVAMSVNHMAAALEKSAKGLSEQQNRIRAIHQSITDGIIVYDRHNHISSANPAAEAAVGMLEEELTGTNATGITQLDSIVSQAELVPEAKMVECWNEKSCTHPDCPSFGSSDLRCWLQCGTHCYNEIQGSFEQKRDACERCNVYRENGLRALEVDHEQRAYKVIISPLLNDTGQEDGRVAVLHDITDIRKADVTLRSQNSELLVLNEIAASLSGNIVELDIVLDEALKKVVAAAGGRAGIVATISPGTTGLNIRAATGINNHIIAFLGLLPAAAIDELEPDEKTGLPDKQKFMRRWKAFGPLLRREGLVDPVIFPFGNTEETRGMLVVADDTKTEYSEVEQRMLRAAAVQVGVALQNADLFKRIEKAKNTWETTFDSMGDCLFVLDTDRNIVMANKAMALLMDTRPEKLVGRKCHKVAHNRCSPIAVCPFDAVVESGEGRSVEIEEPSLGGSFRISINPIKDEQGTVVGLVHVMSDITERNRLREQLLQSEKMVAVGQLVSGVAHELNNPLTGVMGYSQLLLRRLGKTDVNAARDLSAIIEETERATRIVQNLLSFARKHQPKMTVVNVNEVVNRVLQLGRYELGVNNIEVDVRMDDDLPETMADFHQLEQVLLNIINNAVQAVAEVDCPGRLGIRTGNQDGYITVSIEDNGPGISPELQKRIFEPFYTTKDVGKGTGLGLSICYGIIEEHGGGMSVSSRVGEGTTISFTLPVVKTRDGGEEQQTVKDDGDRHRNVLLVDDERAIVDLLSDILTMDGYGVDVAANYSVALRKLSEETYDNVITDISVTSIEGRELYQRIREIDPKLAANVIFITDNDEDDDIRDYLERTGNNYLVKPFDLQDLRHDLQKVMKGNGN